MGDLSDAPVLRVRTPDEGTVSFTDLVRGEVTFAWADIPDFVILRADGTPTEMIADYLQRNVKAAGI